MEKSTPYLQYANLVISSANLVATYMLYMRIRSVEESLEKLKHGLGEIDTRVKESTQGEKNYKEILRKVEDRIRELHESLEEVEDKNGDFNRELERIFGALDQNEITVPSYLPSHDTRTKTKRTHRKTNKDDDLKLIQDIRSTKTAN